MKKVINKSRVFYAVMGFLILVVLVVTGVKFVLEFVVKDEKEVVSKKKLDTLEVYGYSLDDLDTSLYKKYFNELKDVLNKEEIDYNSYATILTKLFVTDFYTLSNKLTSSDIGGIEFVHPDILDNFKLNAGDTMYNHVKNNVYGDRVQDLPEVKDVNVSSVEDVAYDYNGQSYEAFKASASWEYVTDMGYESSGVFYLIKDSNKLYVVETD